MYSKDVTFMGSIKKNWPRLTTNGEQIAPSGGPGVGRLVPG